MTEKLRIGVVVVTFNNAETVHSIIGALVSQTRMPDEIVVIDNASSDNTQDIIKGFQSVRYIRLTENTGSAGGFHDSIVVSIILVISYPLNKLLRLVYQYERNEIK